MSGAPAGASGMKYDPSIPNSTPPSTTRPIPKRRDSRGVRSAPTRELTPPTAATTPIAAASSPSSSTANRK